MAEISAQQAQELLERASDTPWRVGAEGSEGSRINPNTGDKRTDLHYIAAANGRVQPEDGHNAALIAAAPDLAETVITLTERLQQLEEQWDEVRSCNTAAWVIAERADRHGYDVDPHEILEALGHHALGGDQS